MPETRFFRVVNLDEYQHYKDRAPPWIKLHASVLEKYKFARLQDASKAHLMQIWLLASRTGNRLPYDATFIGNHINATSKVDLDKLLALDFIALEQDASAPQAERVQDARPEGEGETKAESEGKRARATQWRDEDVVPTEWMTWAQDELGMTPAQCYQQRDRFVDHFLATGKVMKRWESAWRNWCRRAPDFVRSKPNGSGERKSAVDQMADVVRRYEANNKQEEAT